MVIERGGLSPNTARFTASRDPAALADRGQGGLKYLYTLDAIPAGAYVCDASGRITYFNALAAVTWGRAPKLRDSADRYCGSFKLYSSSDGTPIPHVECWMALALKSGKGYHGREILIEQPGGRRIHAMAFAHPLRNHEDRIIGAVNLVLDITEIKAQQANSGDMSSIVARHHDATLAMIEVGLAALVGMSWATSTFS